MITRIITYRNGPAPHRLIGTQRKDAMDLHLQPDWQRALGLFVQVRRDGKIVRQGTVDAVMPDNSILWISAEGAHPRQMVEKAEGNDVYARYAWDAVPALVGEL